MTALPLRLLHLLGALDLHVPRVEAHHLAPDVAVMVQQRLLTPLEIAVFVQPSDMNVFAAHLQNQLKNPRRLAIEVVVLVDDADACFATLQPLFRGFQPKRATLIVVGDDGTVRVQGRTKLRRAIDAAHDVTQHDALMQRVQHLVETSQDAVVERAEQTKATRQLFSRMSHQSVWGSHLLIACFMGMFALEVAFGGGVSNTEDATVLLRMGAQSPAELGQEWWRQLTAPFLHAGLLHVGMNSYVLWLLGRSLEQLIGSTRLLLLVGLSMVGGAVASDVLADAISVGASGGVWGVLTAYVVLGLKKNGPLTEGLRQQWKRISIFNLGINVMVSFLPFVDKWAHFGGGAVGALLMGSGLLLRGVPPPDAPEDVTITSPTWLKAAAVALGAAFVVAMGINLSTQQPWQLRQPQWVQTDVGGGCMLIAPTATATSVKSPPGGQLWRAGRQVFDPLTASLWTLPEPAPLPSKATPAQLLQVLGKPLDGTQRVLPVQQDADDTVHDLARWPAAPHVDLRRSLVSDGQTPSARWVVETACNRRLMDCEQAHLRVVERVKDTCRAAAFATQR